MLTFRTYHRKSTVEKNNHSEVNMHTCGKPIPKEEYCLDADKTDSASVHKQSTKKVITTQREYDEYIIRTTDAIEGALAMKKKMKLEAETGALQHADEQSIPKEALIAFDARAVKKQPYCKKKIELKLEDVGAMGDYPHRHRSPQHRHRSPQHHHPNATEEAVKHQKVHHKQLARTHTYNKKYVVGKEAKLCNMIQEFVEAAISQALNQGLLGKIQEMSAKVQGLYCKLKSINIRIITLLKDINNNIVHLGTENMDQLRYLCMKWECDKPFYQYNNMMGSSVPPRSSYMPRQLKVHQMPQSLQMQQGMAGMHTSSKSTGLQARAKMSGKPITFASSQKNHGYDTGKNKLTTRAKKVRKAVTEQQQSKEPSGNQVTSNKLIEYIVQEAFKRLQDLDQQTKRTERKNNENRKKHALRPKPHNEGKLMFHKTNKRGESDAMPFHAQQHVSRYEKVTIRVPINEDSSDDSEDGEGDKCDV